MVSSFVSVRLVLMFLMTLFRGHVSCEVTRRHRNQTFLAHRLCCDIEFV
jgi:hypothetical protein